MHKARNRTFIMAMKGFGLTYDQICLFRQGDFKTWGRKLPAPGQEPCLGDIRFTLPAPFLTPQEVANAHALLADWDIASKLIPLAGDFHDMPCLDAATPGAHMVLLNDARQELARFDGYDDLRRCLRTAQPGPNTDGMIISAWFDF